VSTRLIGAVIMAHSDDKGLVLPPRLAPVEVVIVPIFKNETKERVLGFARSLRDTLRSGFRVLLDEDDQNTPGWKFSEYELQGIPLRVEVGPRDMEKGQVVAVRRDTGEKTFVPVAEAPALLRASLEDIQAGLYRRALEFRRQNTFRAADYGEFRKLIDEPGGFIEAGWCGDAACEAKVKEETKATIRLIPLERKDTGGAACMVCGKTAQDIAVFARAY
jgi:prolyl-tRNA synthetase